jgi:hypothetical protein
LGSFFNNLNIYRLSVLLTLPLISITFQFCLYAEIKNVCILFLIKPQYLDKTVFQDSNKNLTQIAIQESFYCIDNCFCNFELQLINKIWIIWLSAKKCIDNKFRKENKDICVFGTTELFRYCELKIIDGDDNCMSHCNFKTHQRNIVIILVIIKINTFVVLIFKSIWSYLNKTIFRCCK